jgi:anti-sigma factor RsiW
MRCLTDIEVQAVVDGEASDERRAHAETCEECRSRVEERRSQMETIASLIDADGMPSSTLEARLRYAMSESSGVRGSTVLRARTLPAWRRVGLVSALATAAVIALLVYGVLPRLGAPTTLSASEVLERSLQTMSNGQGVERLEYEVAMDGMTAGPVVIRQVIDRDNPHRYKVASYAPDGTIATAVSQDPTKQQRTQLFHVDGTNYIVRVGAIHTPVLSIPQMAQALVETSIGIMQAKADQQLTIEDSPSGRRYVVEIPPVTPQNATATLDLFSARAVISGTDFRIQEFTATGTLLRQPFSVSLKLRTHEYVGGEATADSFAITPGPDDVVLEGQAAEDPVTELMTTVLRELSRARGK